MNAMLKIICNSPDQFQSSFYFYVEITLISKHNCYTTVSVFLRSILPDTRKAVIWNYK